ncbi:hypothetical protein WSS15_12140 [Acetobacter pasteurianus]|uniref:Uncharacterized protein n=3 Tax=Acetobacter pasteurianus TaxID=438 RepID=C7JHL8_ACEP3|nr:hypothetical protein [Acetobacter pasteurianus]ASC07029.1 hypothetical protein S101468_02827 [Acetobacter pasteurianus subsp. pasteurianus]BAH99472.1 hypothetical protein APA01_13260 [Acetobacter pasteurianus IFO 3283-01]BAI02525.1 hypothetical protein APA03_13260 [Acetobacter pasteurianus IFO 3283-03]BAI05571.1 hypothetical protein APA07_13260 [Acetobacter pasteurianus IFO 3283-07]BAI08620.1 hypothetical protein APA22_13260 [Acetobacter pasteurianus IFO 3283-22]
MSAYSILRTAIEQKKAVAFTLHDKPQVASPHALGKGDGVEKVLMYRGVDAHEKRVPAQGQWDCIAVSELSDVKLLADEPFHQGHPDAAQRAGIREVDIEL